jgi:hypothetical protein
MDLNKSAAIYDTFLPLAWGTLWQDRKLLFDVSRSTMLEFDSQVAVLPNMNLGRNQF